MAEQEEGGFTVRDRRRVHLDDPMPTETAPPPVAVPPAPVSAVGSSVSPATSASAFVADVAGQNRGATGAAAEFAAMMRQAQEAEAMASAPGAMGVGYGEAMMGDESMGEMAEGEDANELPDVYSMLALFLSELRNMAWLRMGLVPNPMTGQMEPDLQQAKVAIDSVTFLASQLEPMVAPEERSPLRALVQDLQMNFLEQAKRSGL